MKYKIIITALALVGVMAASAAPVIGFSRYAVGGTAINAGTNYAIIPPDSANGGEPVITYLNMNALFASGSSTLTAYVSTNQTTATAANATTTNTVASTNGFAAGQWVVIQHLQVDNRRFRNEAVIISAVQNTNQIVLATAPVTAVAAGDIFDQQTAWSTIPLATSATSREISGSGIVSGQRSEPFLLTLVGSAAGTNTINAADAFFAP